MEKNKQLISNRKNGRYYTPRGLANFLARPLLKASNISILDPAYGEGALLLAAERILHKKNKRAHLKLFGCDIKPVNGLLQHLPEANLKKINFFDYSEEYKHGVILTNPPFVRHHSLSVNSIAKYRKNIVDDKILNQYSDLWAYFIVKCVSHLRPGGALGAILPWSFLQADYAQPLRKWLYELFGSIRVLALSNKYFEGAEERIVLVWMKDFGKKCNSLEIGTARQTGDKVLYMPSSYDNWISDRVAYSGNEAIQVALQSIKARFRFNEFDNHATVLIGVVTGAVDFFIKPAAIAKDLGFKKRNLIPIITTAKEFSGYLNYGIDKLKQLIRISRKDYRSHVGFLQGGVRKTYNERAHSKLRDPWYAVRIGKIPDAFFPYRVSKTPYLLNNEFGVQSTNAVHRIYYKKITKVERMWIEVSLLSNIGQLSIESNSKTYGRGMLKIEPSSLKKSLVYRSKDKGIIPIYKQVIRELKADNRVNASRIATNFINRHLKIPRKMSRQVDQLLNEIHTIRLC